MTFNQLLAFIVAKFNVCAIKGNYFVQIWLIFWSYLFFGFLAQKELKESLKLPGNFPRKLGQKAQCWVSTFRLNAKFWPKLTKFLANCQSKVLRETPKYFKIQTKTHKTSYQKSNFHTSKLHLILLSCKTANTACNKLNQKHVKLSAWLTTIFPNLKPWSV